MFSQNDRDIKKSPHEATHLGSITHTELWYNEGNKTANVGRESYNKSVSVRAVRDLTCTCEEEAKERRGERNFVHSIGRGSEDELHTI